MMKCFRRLPIKKKKIYKRNKTKWKKDTKKVQNVQRENDTFYFHFNNALHAATIAILNDWSVDPFQDVIENYAIEE